MVNPEFSPNDYPSPYVTPDEIQFIPPRRQFRIYHLFVVITIAGVVLALATQVNLQLAILIGYMLLAFGLHWFYHARPWLTFPLLGVLCLMSLCISLPPITASRVAALPAQCRSNMRQFALALAAYEEEHGSYPPAYIADAQGRPMHSWRVLLLPYLGEEKLYKQYRFDEPWNSPNNLKVADAATTSLGMLCCPLARQNSTGITQYVAVIGPETMWPGEKSRMLYQVTDSPRNDFAHRMA